MRIGKYNCPIARVHLPLRHECHTEMSHRQESYVLDLSHRPSANFIYVVGQNAASSIPRRGICCQSANRSGLGLASFNQPHNRLSFDIGHPPPAAPTMGTCQSKRYLPRDSLYVMIGVTDDAELRERYRLEEELPPGDGMYRPSALDEFLDAMEEQGSAKIKINKRTTMDTCTLCSSIRSTSSTTLVEPTPSVRECSLAA